MDWWQTWVADVQEDGVSLRLLFSLCFGLAHSGTFIVLNLWLMMCYRNDWFLKYRIQGNVLPEWSLIKECLISNVITHCVVSPLAIWYGYDIFLKYGIDLVRPAPNLLTILRDFVIFIGFNDTLFYWVHRLVHHKYLYKYIHKHHHRFKINVGICAEFANPVEDVFANIMPTIIGAFVMGSHPVTLFAWLVLRVWETVDAHSGYSFKWSPFKMFWWQGGPDRHDFHHSHNIGCYGSFTIFWDWFCHTDQAFLDFTEKQRRAKLAVPTAAVDSTKSPAKSSPSTTTASNIVESSATDDSKSPAKAKTKSPATNRSKSPATNRSKSPATNRSKSPTTAKTSPVPSPKATRTGTGKKSN
jgi:sterol desaturase/sphingolipid hydroxylase (fatty acid hydroxylase superfamily)